MWSRYQNIDQIIVDRGIASKFLTCHYINEKGKKKREKGKFKKENETLLLHIPHFWNFVEKWEH